ncbi:hypothetical protein BU17DRAFT_62107 [Hysterangium stoloniferum]|nr:hypothetical protein BU17DRAFT_62107 [Hysterangium stoloniferum]
MRVCTRDWSQEQTCAMLRIQPKTDMLSAVTSIAEDIVSCRVGDRILKGLTFRREEKIYLPLVANGSVENQGRSKLAIASAERNTAWPAFGNKRPASSPIILDQVEIMILAGGMIFKGAGVLEPAGRCERLVRGIKTVLHSEDPTCLLPNNVVPFCVLEFWATGQLSDSESGDLEEGKYSDLSLPWGVIGSLQLGTPNSEFRQDATIASAIREHIPQGQGLYYHVMLVLSMLVSGVTWTSFVLAWFLARIISGFPAPLTYCMHSSAYEASKLPVGRNDDEIGSGFSSTQLI